MQNVTIGFYIFVIFFGCHLIEVEQLKKSYKGACLAIVIWPWGTTTVAIDQFDCKSVA